MTLMTSKMTRYQNSKTCEKSYQEVMKFFLLSLILTNISGYEGESLFNATGSMSQRVLHNVICPEKCVCRNFKHEGLTVNCTLQHLSNESDFVKFVKELPSATRNLYIINNGIRSLPPQSLNQMHTLKEVYLPYNGLTHFTSWNQAFDPGIASELSHLSLSHNELKSILPRVFSIFNKLHSLDLSVNKISIIHPQSFLGLESLLLLNLRNNSLHTLRKTNFMHLHILQQLFLEYNLIKSIEEGTFSSLQNLQTLYLIGNRLQVIQDTTFMGANNLHQLYISDNFLTTVDADAINQLKELSELWLDGNQLITLDVDLERAFQRMGYGPINLNRNPFNCDCNILWMANWLRQHPQEISSSDIMVPYPECLSPSKLNGRAIQTIPFQEFHCENSTYKTLKCPKIVSTTLSLKNKTTVSKDPCKRLWDATCNLHKHHPNQRTHSKSVNFFTSCLCSGSFSDCYVCPSGWYGPHTNNASEIKCQACPAMKGSLHGGIRKEDCQCLAGFYPNKLNPHTCEACPVGYFKPRLGSQPCQKCSIGSISRYPGATVCECLPGYQLNASSAICERCPPGKYKAHKGLHQCRPCPEYSTSPSGSISIDQCQCLYSKASFGLLSSPHRVCFGPNVPHRTDGQQIQMSSNNTELLSIVLPSVALLCAVLLGMFKAIQRLLLRETRKQEKIAEAKKAQIVQICIPQPVEETWIRTNLASWEIPRERLKLGQLLGQGAFGLVYEAYLHTDRIMKVAVKCCREGGMSSEEQEALWSELKLLLYVGKHCNVISLIGTSYEQGSLMVILEYAIHGDLLTFLRSRSTITIAPTNIMAPGNKANRNFINLKRLNSQQNLLNCSMVPNVLYNDPFINRFSNNRQRVTNEETAILLNSPNAIDKNEQNVEDVLLLSLAWQITKGMTHLEQLKCIHRDLACRNILLADDMVVKISDFGLAREAYESGYYFRQSKGRLPFKWMAPEALLQGQCTNKSDVWSYGIVLWEMMTLGANPYPGVPLDSLVDLLLSGYRMPKPDCCREDIYEIMKLCWRECPSDRPSFRNLSIQLDDILQTVSNYETTNQQLSNSTNNS